MKPKKKYTGGEIFLLVWKLVDNSQRKFSFQIMSVWAYFLIDSTEDFRIDHNTNTKSNTTRLSQKSRLMVISKLFSHLVFLKSLLTQFSQQTHLIVIFFSE